MKKLALCVFGLLLVSSHSFAVPVRSYLGASTGAVLPINSTVTDANGTRADVSYKPGYSVGGVVGHEFGTGLRLEGEVNYTKADYDKINSQSGTNRLNSDLWSLGLFTNAYYDLLISRTFTPYIGAGIGVKSISVSNAEISGVRIWNSSHDSVFAYQTGFGCGIRMTRDVTFDMGYRYQGTGNFKIDQVTSGSGDHRVFFGIRYYP